MNGLEASAGELEKIIAGARSLAQSTANVEVMVCPPATLLAGFAALAWGTPVSIGGQDCHAEPSGAHTGDIAAEMLRDAGAKAVIVGHSERRQNHGETNAMVRAKALAARRAGFLQSFASARRAPSAMAARHAISLGHSSTDRFRTERAISSSPMSRSGRSAPA